MRKTTAVAGVLGLTALALVGCSAQPLTPEACGRVADTAPSVMSAIEVQGAAGEQPTTTAPENFVATEAAHADLAPGSGELITSMSQVAAIDVMLVDAASGTEVPLTEYTGDDASVVPLSQVVQQLPGLEPALECAGEGSRVVAALGEGGVEETVAAQLQQFGASGDASRMVAVVDVHRVVPAAASGSSVYNDGHGLPSVVRSPEGVPGVVVPDGAAPTSATTETLIAGDGAELGEGDVVTVHAQSVDWATKAVGTSTWSRGTPATGPLAEIGLPDEAVSALEGATVGSQVLAVVPDGEGGAAIWVIDLLGAAPAS